MSDTAYTKLQSQTGAQDKSETTVSAEVDKVIIGTAIAFTGVIGVWSVACLVSAMFQAGGKPYETWRTSLATSVLAQQRKDGDFCQYRGSWDPIGPWGPDGGRVYSTALLALCLEVRYRYPRVSGGR